jgi:hypothetical protein
LHGPAERECGADRKRSQNYLTHEHSSPVAPGTDRGCLLDARSPCPMHAPPQDGASYVCRKPASTRLASLSACHRTGIQSGQGGLGNDWPAPGPVCLVRPDEAMIVADCPQIRCGDTNARNSREDKYD